MKYQIRKSVWESNSSSMHSLVVTKKNSNVRMTQEEIRAEFYLDEEWYKKLHKNDEKEVVDIDPWENDFGRSPFSVLSSFRDKLYYAVAEYWLKCLSEITGVLSGCNWDVHFDDVDLILDADGWRFPTDVEYAQRN